MRFYREKKSRIYLSSYLSCFKYLCTRANIMAYLNHICLTFLRDKCDNRFVSHLGHLIGGQIWRQICLRFVFEANIIKSIFSSSVFGWKSKLKSFWSWHMKEFRVLNESFESSVKPRLLYDILAKTYSWELYSTCFFLLIIIIIKVKIQSVSSVLSVPSCWSLTIIIVWENHKQCRLTDCLGVAKLSSKHWNFVICTVYSCTILSSFLFIFRLFWFIESSCCWHIFVDMM